MFCFYVLYSESTGRYYVGSTQEVAQRLTQHNAGMMRSTRSGRPWRLIHAEEFESRVEAVRRERQIKSWKSPAYMKQVIGL